MKKGTRRCRQVVRELRVPRLRMRVWPALPTGRLSVQRDAGKMRLDIESNLRMRKAGLGNPLLSTPPDLRRADPRRHRTIGDPSFRIWVMAKRQDHQ